MKTMNVNRHKVAAIKRTATCGVNCYMNCCYITWTATAT
jgi:hypothetical protein